MAQSILPESEIKPNEFENIQALHTSVLNVSSRTVLSSLLNSRKELPELFQGGTQISRDWRGLAELIGLNYAKIKRIGDERDPTSVLLDYWGRRDESTIGKLLEYLEQMERYDVIDDAEQSMLRDAKEFNKTLQEKSIGVVTNEANEPLYFNDEEPLTLSVSHTNGAIMPPTIYDVHGLEDKYDAFICYGTSDMKFVKELTERMEHEYYLKLFIKDRDMLIGVPEFMAQLRILQRKCGKFVIVCSPDFVVSRMFIAVLAYAQHIAVNVDQYIIPVIHKKCILPDQLKHIFNLDFNCQNIFQNFWEKLAESIKPELFTDRLLNKRTCITNGNTEDKVHIRDKACIQNPALGHTDISHQKFGYGEKPVEDLCEQKLNEVVRLQRKLEEKASIEMSDCGSGESKDSKTDEGSCSSTSITSEDHKLNTNEINEKKQKSKEQKGVMSKMKTFMKNPLRKKNRKELYNSLEI